MRWVICEATSMKMNKTSSPITSFPPKDLAGFLDLCAGSWISLRSHFELGNSDTGWHCSQHNYINVKRIAESAERCLGGIALKPPKGPEQELYFLADGRFNLKGAQQASGARNFRSGNLELNICRDFHFRNFWCLGTRGSPKYSWSNNVARLFNFNGNLFNGKWFKTVRNHFWGEFSFFSQNMTRNWTFDKFNLRITSEASFKEG